MGLFRKRHRTEEELAAMRNEMRALREQLEKSDAAKAQLAERMGHLDAESKRLNTEVGSVQERVGEVDTKIGSVQHDVDAVAGGIGPAIDDAVKTVAEQAPKSDDVVDGLRSQLVDLTASLQAQQSQIADVALVATDAAERSTQADLKIADMVVPDGWAPIDTTPARDADAETKQQMAQLAEKVAALDARVNQVSLELTNQLTELSSDVDRAHEQGATPELIDRINEQLDDITGGQQRLATEQARYAIQFREDLAELADRLRKPR